MPAAPAPITHTSVSIARFVSSLRLSTVHGFFSADVLPLGTPLAALPESHPPKLLEADAVVLDLRHMADLVTIELHHIDVVRLYALSGGWHRPAFTRMGAAEHACTR